MRLYLRRTLIIVFLIFSLPARAVEIDRPPIPKPRPDITHAPLSFVKKHRVFLLGLSETEFNNTEPPQELAKANSSAADERMRPFLKPMDAAEILQKIEPHAGNTEREPYSFRISFIPGTLTLSDDERAFLRKVVKAGDVTDYSLAIFTEDETVETHNGALSRARAMRVKDFLVAHGFNEKRIHVQDLKGQYKLEDATLIQLF